MIKMFFHIQFRGQLKRTRPELIGSLEDAVAASAYAAGGIVETGRKVFSASFDEDRICFWLDIVVFLKEVCAFLERASPELFGYALVLGRNSTETSAQKLCRFNIGKNKRETSGIWCSEEILDSLKFYIVFGRSTGNKKRNAPDGYRKIKEFRSFESDRENCQFTEKIKSALAEEKMANTLFLGSALSAIHGLSDIKTGVYQYCASFPWNIPPIIIRFGAGGRGIVCFMDAWTEELRAFINSASTSKELDAIYDLLFRERLRDEWSPYMIEQGRKFIHCLLTAYIAAAKSEGSFGVLILEDISLADASSRIFIEVYSSAFSSQVEKEKLLVLGLDSLHEKSLEQWKSVFDRVLNFSDEEIPHYDAQFNFLKKMPPDLIELSYCVSLFGHYFPVHVFPQLFEEVGLTRDAYLQAQHILTALGLSTPEDPRPLVDEFESLAEKILKKRIAKIRSMVGDLLLSWAVSGRLHPCFNLIRILSDLGENTGNALVLQSIRADVFNGTWNGIEKAISGEVFGSIVGKTNAPILEYIYKTLKALVWGNSMDIRLIFKGTAPPDEKTGEEPFSAISLAHVQTNLAAFYIGAREGSAAFEAIRKALLFNKSLGEDTVPAYRFFSLANFSRQRIDDALEYISFAIEQAEKTKLHEEVFLTYYYASSINMIYGNLSKAERLTYRAEEAAYRLGQMEWGMKAKFLRGRLFFEIGRYGEALEIFESIISINQTANQLIDVNIVQTVEAWIYRTKNLLGRFSLLSKNSVSKSSDAAIFEIEAAYFFADYKMTDSLAQDFLDTNDTNDTNEETNEVFFFTEQPDWRSGFSQCEYMFHPEKVPGTRLARVYQAMAKCALNPSPTVKTESLSWMQQFLRDELLPDTDPNDAIYFYAWFCMLADIETSQVDLKTVISMAIKRIQRRAGRIDDMETRQAFLHLPRWNSALYMAARENKLI